ncbi:10346_t:CDS:2, partial [Funneliformis caledonium]
GSSISAKSTTTSKQRQKYQHHNHHPKQAAVLPQPSSTSSNPKPTTGSELNKQLIETYGIAIEYCINDASTLLLKELFDTNIIATAQKKFDYNFHPVGLVTGAQGIGKSRLLMECVNHIRKRFPGILKDLVDLIIVSYNNGNTPSDLDLQLGV